MVLSYQDPLANAAATATHANVSIDTTAPVVTPPANVTASPTSAAGAVLSYPAATATDANGVLSITYSQNSGTSFPVGSTTVTVTASDTAYNIGAATFAVTVLALTPVQDWRQLHFGSILNTGIAADTADPNGNGLANLTEYALNGDPSGTTTGITILPVAGRSADNTQQIVFTRYTDRSDITLTVQANDTLADPWTDPPSMFMPRQRIIPFGLTTSCYRPAISDPWVKRNHDAGLPCAS